MGEPSLSKSRGRSGESSRRNSRPGSRQHGRSGASCEKGLVGFLGGLGGLYKKAFNSYKKKPLEAGREPNHAFADGPHHKLSFVVNSQLAHQIELVRVHRLAAEPKNVRCR